MSYSSIRPLFYTQDIEPLEGEGTSIACTQHDQVWVGRAVSTGGLLVVYDAKTCHRVATWSSEECVRKILYNSSEDVIVAITRRAFHVFSSLPDIGDMKPLFSHSIADDITEVVLVNASRSDWKLLLWYCADTKFKVLKISPSNTSCKTYRQNASGTVSHMEALWKEDGTKLNHIVLSHGSCIEKWDIESKERLEAYDCSDYCSHLYDNNGKQTYLILCIHSMCHLLF